MADQRLYRKVADGILDLVASGQFPPGTRLPGERELASRFNVSRVVVREAEIALEALGHVDIRVGSGVYVLDKANISFNRLPVVSAFELTQTRLLFESECAALSATMITKDQLGQLEKTIELMGSARGNSSDGEQADKDFHHIITKSTKNRANEFFMENLWRMRNEIDEVKRVYAAVCVTDSTHRVKEHMDIFEALRRSDPEAARHAMREHFTRLLEALLDASEQQAIEEAKKKFSSERKQFLRVSHP